MILIKKRSSFQITLLLPTILLLLIAPLTIKATVEVVLTKDDICSSAKTSIFKKTKYDEFVGKEIIAKDDENTKFYFWDHKLE